MQVKLHRDGQAKFIEKPFAFILDQPQGSIIAGYTKTGLRGDPERDIPLSLSFTGKDFGVAYMEQVHGSNIKSIDKPGSYECDGLFTGRGGIALVVKTADCMPILMYSKKEGMIGAIHMEWRSAKEGILDNIGYDLSSFSCIAGVGMRKCCYEVGEEFRDYDGVGLFLEQRPGSYYFDPVAFIREKLTRRGLCGDNFFDIGICSVCSGQGFFSHRRDGTSGRTLSFIAKHRETL